MAILVFEDVDNGVCEDVDNGVFEGVDNVVCIVRIDAEGGGPTCVGCPFVEDGPVLEDGLDADDDPVADDLVDEGVHSPVGEEVHLPTRVRGAKDVRFRV